MSVRIDVEHRGGEAFVTVRGVIDRTVRDVAAGLVGIGRDCENVVVDLCDAVIASPRGIQDLLTALGESADHERIALVCDRLAGRRLLRLACGTAGVRVLGEPPEGAGAAAADLPVSEPV